MLKEIDMIFNKIKEQGRTLVGSFMLALVLIMSSGCSKKESTIGGAAIGAGTGVAIGAAAGGTGRGSRPAASCSGSPACALPPRCGRAPARRAAAACR